MLRKSFPSTLMFNKLISLHGIDLATFLEEDLPFSALPAFGVRSAGWEEAKGSRQQLLPALLQCSKINNPRTQQPSRVLNLFLARKPFHDLNVCSAPEWAQQVRQRAIMTHKQPLIFGACPRLPSPLCWRIISARILDENRHTLGCTAK